MRAGDDSSPAPGPRDERYWGQWRGPLDTGVATRAKPPTEWNESKNIRWKVPVPGPGHSSPIVWNNRIYLTAAIPHGEPVDPPVGIRPGAHDNIIKVRRTRFVVAALDRNTGKTVWKKTLRDSLPHESRHDTGSYASASPITDGKRIFAFFGSNGLFALDLEGTLLWEKDLGDMHTKHGHGEGASPALYGETLVVNWDHEGPSFIVAFDAIFAPIGLSDPFHVTRPDGTLQRTGLITEEGVECLAMRDEDEFLYTLVGNLDGLSVGDPVVVEARYVEVSTCQQGTTLEVIESRPPAS